MVRNVCATCTHMFITRIALYKIHVLKLMKLHNDRGTGKELSQYPDRKMLRNNLSIFKVEQALQILSISLKLELANFGAYDLKH